MRLLTCAVALLATLATFGAAGQARADTATFIPVADAFVNGVEPPADVVVVAAGDIAGE